MSAVSADMVNMEGEWMAAVAHTSGNACMQVMGWEVGLGQAKQAVVTGMPGREAAAVRLVLRCIKVSRGSLGSPMWE